MFITFLPLLGSGFSPDGSKVLCQRFKHAVVTGLAHHFQRFRIRDATGQSDLNRFVDDERLRTADHILDQFGNGTGTYGPHVKYLLAHLEQMRFRTSNEILRATDDEAQFARPHRGGNTGHASVNNKYRFRLRCCFYLFHGLRQNTAVKENQRSGGRSLQDAIRTRHALNNVFIRAYDDVYKRGFRSRRPLHSMRFHSPVRALLQGLADSCR